MTMTTTVGVCYVDRIDLANLLPHHRLVVTTVTSQTLIIEVPGDESAVVVNDGTGGGSRLCMTRLWMRLGFYGSPIELLLPDRHLVADRPWQCARSGVELSISSMYVLA